MNGRWALAAVLAALVGGYGCASGDDDDGAGQGDGGATGSAGEDDVRCPDDIPEFFAGETSGMEVMGMNEEIKARLISSDHVPPKRFSNSWTIEVMAADGTTLEDATIVKACAFMPVHGHGSAPRRVVELEPGRFELQQLNFSMRGPWEVQLAVSSDSVPEAEGDPTKCDLGVRGTDYLAFNICVLDE